MELINNEAEQHKIPSPTDIHRMDIALEELIRRAKLQAGEVSLLIQRLEHLRRDIGRHLCTDEDPSGHRSMTSPARRQGSSS